MINNNSSRFELSPFKYGEAMARSGYAYYTPYLNAEKSRKFKQGYDAYKALTLNQVGTNA